MVRLWRGQFTQKPVCLSTVHVDAPQVLGKIRSALHTRPVDVQRYEHGPQGQLDYVAFLLIKSHQVLAEKRID